MKNDATSKYNYFKKSHPNNECSLLSRDTSHKSTYSKEGTFLLHLIKISFSNSYIYLIINNESISNNLDKHPFIFF